MHVPCMCHAPRSFCGALQCSRTRAGRNAAGVRRSSRGPLHVRPRHGPYSSCSVARQRSRTHPLLCARTDARTGAYSFAVPACASHCVLAAVSVRGYDTASIACMNVPGTASVLEVSSLVDRVRPTAVQELTKTSGEAAAAKAQVADRERLQAVVQALHAEHHRVLSVLTARNTELEHARASLQEHVRRQHLPPPWSVPAAQRRRTTLQSASSCDTRCMPAGRRSAAGVCDAAEHARRGVGGSARGAQQACRGGAATRTAAPDRRQE